MNSTKLNCTDFLNRCETVHCHTLYRLAKIAMQKAKCEKKLWNVKTMKIDGKKMLISYMKFRMHDSLLKTSSETES